MSHHIRLILLLHNHQPIGNFEDVFEQAYRDSYLPFLDVFERYQDLSITLHTSGPLMGWLDANHPEYLDRVMTLVADGRIEILGGAFYEPILSMIPSRDREGQIREYTRWLEGRLGARVRGMWIPERVWEQPMTRDIARAGIEYTLLDDFHFKNAGLQQEDLSGYYVTEDEGQLLSIFPGSERLRYLIPFADPEKTVDYLRDFSQQRPGAVVAFGDDGEKFGTWPETKKHVYDNGWLVRFFDALVANRDWLQVCTMSDAYDSANPLGKIYLPEGSYREMTEWVLPVEQQLEYGDVRQEMRGDSRWSRIAPFIRGGFWRNFKVRYPESNEMYSRMMMVSQRLEDAVAGGADPGKLQDARHELYRGQCNCSYWHGAFGGIYLPHLRNAVYNHLIAADNLLDDATGQTGARVEVVAADYNLDSRSEVRLANDKLIALVAPAMGGQLYELDVRSICHNLLATLARRPEAYHRTVLEGVSDDVSDDASDAASIHDRVIYKQDGLDQRLQYDRWPRKSLLDHFYDDQVSLDAIADGDARELGDFVAGHYEAKLRRNPDRIQVQLSRTGVVDQSQIRITKGITMQAGSGTLEIAYLLEDLPPDRTLHFAVEMNFAGLPAGADDRYFHQGEGAKLGPLETRLDLCDATDLGMVDHWLGIDVRLSANRPTNIWTYPVETVSQSEGGFELVHQSVVMLPHWRVQGDSDGRWSLEMKLDIDTSLAENRRPFAAEIVVS